MRQTPLEIGIGTTILFPQAAPWITFEDEEKQQRYLKTIAPNPNTNPKTNPNNNPNANPIVNPNFNPNFNPNINPNIKTRKCYKFHIIKDVSMFDVINLCVKKVNPKKSNILTVLHVLLLVVLRSLIKKLHPNKSCDAFIYCKPSSHYCYLV